MIAIHTVPFAMMVMNTLLSRMRFIYSHCVYVMLLGVIYTAVNYFGSIYRQKPLYPFLNWKVTPMKSVFNASFLVLGSCVLFILGAFLIDLFRKVTRSN